MAIEALTVHASRPIRAGEEVSVHCGLLPPDCILREQRQRYLYATLGFVCECTACSYRGAALQASEARRLQIGDRSSILRELIACAQELVSIDHTEVLRRLDRYTCR